MAEGEIFRYYGFAEESERGVAEETPEMHCDAQSLSPGIPDATEMEYKGSMGRGKTLHRPGFYSTSPKFEIGTDLKVLARKMYFTLGNRIVRVTEGDGSGLDPDSVLYYDSSANSFTSKKTAFKDSNANDVAIPGHAAAEVDDYLAMGYGDKFDKITVVVGTAKTDISTLVFEYWDGDEWKTLTVTDSTTGFSVAGEGTITFSKPDDWQKRSLNSSGELYFIRIRCSAFTSEGVAGSLTSGTVSTQPDLSTEYIYSSNNILLPTFTGFFGIDMDEFIVPGIVLDKLEFSVEKEFVMLKGDMAGMQESLGELKTEDELLINEDYPLAFYEVNLHMRPKGSTTPWGADTLISSDVKKLQYSHENGAKAEDGQGLGSRFPYIIPVGERKISIDFDYNYITRNWYNMMQGGENGPQSKIGTTEFELMIEIDAGKYGSAQGYLPRVIVTKAPIESKGRDPIVQGISIDAYQDSITVPTTPEQTVYSETLWTFVHKFPDLTSGADMPAWAQETP